MNCEADWLSNLSTITRTEMSKKFHNGLPPCLKINISNYKIGEYTVTEKDSEWILIKHDDLPKMFVNLTSAMLYCIYTYDNDLVKSRKILELNEKICRIGGERSLFKSRLISAYKKSDDWKVDLYTARYIDITDRFNRESIELNKLLGWLMCTRFKKLTLEIK